MIVYASRTGNVRSIVENLDLPFVELSEGLVTTSPYILFTYTDGLGSVPEPVQLFLSIETNQCMLRGVIASGNTNFGESFCKSADIIANEYNVPIIKKIDLRGTSNDLKDIRLAYEKLLR